MSLKKEPRLSLGITIAGGRDCRSRLPVYITSVQPVGCLHRDGTIKRGTKELLTNVCLQCLCLFVSRAATWKIFLLTVHPLITYLINYFSYDCPKILV